MAKVSLPYEVKASFRVPRDEAEKLVSRFKTSVSVPGLLPEALESSDAGIDPDSGKNSDATIWVLFKPKKGPNRAGQPSLERSRRGTAEPVPASAFGDFIAPDKSIEDSV
jgi:hypothetical protein